MQRSRYTLLIDDFPERGKHLFFCTRTQAVVVIDDQLKRGVERLPSNGTGPGVDQAMQELRRRGFLVADRGEDTRIIEEWFRRIRTDTSHLKVILLTTYACNFACSYCVEEGVKAPVFMTEETAREAVSFIRKQAVRLGCKALSVSFYGGEPLLNLRAIRTVSAGLRAFCQENGLEFGFTVTTNGALLTPAIVNELKELGLLGVKITVDGTPEHHNRKRPFKNGRGSFATIMENLTYAVDHIGVDLGGNFDADNAESFPVLLDHLKARGLVSKLRKVSFKPISQTPKDREYRAASSELECVFSDAWTAERMAVLRRCVLEKGFASDPGIGINLCSVVMDSSVFVVDPEGKLFKCPALVGHRDFQVGSLAEGFIGTPASPDLWRRCLECAYLPLCGDGCLYGAYLRFGDPMRLNCQRDHVEYTVRENLKMNYRYRKTR
jgi:uncharacterized protein